ncbi:MAG TPA: SDR family oxidoreductase [Terriglobales bacterium]|nr:SDR family oxidoreductase [Terriglobales bacterium]
MPKPDGERLAGKIALVTGATRGIGLAIARVLAAEGCQLVITGRDNQTLQAVARDLSPAEVLAQPCDVRDPSSVSALFAAIKQEFGHLDSLINNAGVSHAIASVEKLLLEAWTDVIATNLTGTFLVTRAALPLLGNGGAIVNNLSIAAIRVFAGQAAYCASKHAALALTKSLREEVRPLGIRVIALLPGATDTDIWQQFWPDAPRARMLRPETVAAAVLDAILLPPDSTVEEVVLMPTSGAL